MGDTTDIAIYDATNSTKERRRFLVEQVTERGGGARVIFVESVCNDPAIVNSNVRETKLQSPDYAGKSTDEAVADFLQRIAHYATVYQPMDETEGWAYIRLVDAGRKVESHRINGYLQGRIMTFLASLYIRPRPIWLTRHGESLDNVMERIGGDTPLSVSGQTYARALARFMAKHYPRYPRLGTELSVWTSTLRRTIETVQCMGYDEVQWRQLDEISGGLCDGMTYEQIAKQMPEEYAARQKDKLFYRYPRGASAWWMLRCVHH
jgi:hypothetical protein